MTFEEYTSQMGALVDQLVKALNEIITEMQNDDQVPQRLVDKLQAAQAVAQQLDDLNPDEQPAGADKPPVWPSPDADRDTK